MTAPGFSISELIGAVDWTVKFIIELKQVPDQIRALETKLEVSLGHLEVLAPILHVLETRNLGINDRIIAALREFQHELLDVLNDTLDFLKRFHPDNASKFFSLSNLGKNVRWMVDKRYQGNLKSLEDRISEIDRNINNKIGALHFLYTLKSENEQQLQQGSRLSSDKETEPTSSSANSQILCTNLISKQPTNGTSPQFSTHSVACPPLLPPLPPFQGLTGTLTGSTVCSSPSLDVIGSPRQASTFTNIACTREILPTKGAIKVFFHDRNENKHIPYEMRSVAILRNGTGYFHGIYMIRSDGNILTDEIPWQNVARHPKPVHQSESQDCTENGMQAPNCIRFVRDTKVAPRMPSTPKYYSFFDVEDYRLFQSRIVGETLLFWKEVQKISSAWSKTELCTAQVLQLWENKGVRSIRFFRNGKENVYSVHKVSRLQVEKESISKRLLKLRFLKSEQPSLAGSLQELEEKMDYLSITFMDPKAVSEFRQTAGFLVMEKKSMRWLGRP